MRARGFWFWQWQRRRPFNSERIQLPQAAEQQTRCQIPVKKVRSAGAYAHLQGVKILNDMVPFAILKMTLNGLNVILNVAKTN